MLAEDTEFYVDPNEKDKEKVEVAEAVKEKNDSKKTDRVDKTAKVGRLNMVFKTDRARDAALAQRGEKEDKREKENEDNKEKKVAKMVEDDGIQKEIFLGLKRTKLDDPIKLHRARRGQEDLFEDDCNLAKKIEKRYFAYNFNRNRKESNIKKQQIDREQKGILDKEDTQLDGRPSSDITETCLELLSLPLPSKDKEIINGTFYYDLRFNDIVLRYSAESDPRSCTFEHLSLQELELTTRDIQDIISELPSRVQKCLIVDQALNLIVKNRQEKAQHQIATELNHYISLTKQKTMRDDLPRRNIEPEIEDSEDSLPVVIQKPITHQVKEGLISRMRSYTLIKKVKVELVDQEIGQPPVQIKENTQEVHSAHFLLVKERRLDHRHFFLCVK